MEKGRGGDKENLIFFGSLVSLSPCHPWGGEVNLRFYPDHPGLPRKPIPSLAISTALEPIYAIKNANFLAFFNNLIYVWGPRDGE